MRLALHRGKILRIRPGHLANFSGGADYLLYNSASTSFLFGLVGSLVLYCIGKDFDSDSTTTSAARARALLGTPDTEGSDATRTALYDVADYARWHLRICAVLTIAMGAVFFYKGLGIVHDSKFQDILVILVLAAGPFVACFLSTLMLVHLTYRSGARFVNLLIAGGAHVGLVFVCILLRLILSAITGASI